MTKSRRVLPGMHGVLLVDKPQRHTSHDVVARVRKAAGGVRCGHAGTLDPMATGVLPVLVGDAARLSEWLMEHDKEYEFTLCFGLVTDTGDVWGSTQQENPAPKLDESAIRALVARFVGPRMQIPPMYSAVKVNGRKLHEEARRGREIERPARPVVIHSLTVLAWNPPFLRLHVCCSKGTYIRSLAEEIGQEAGCGACVSELRRVRAGAFRVENAVELEQVLSPEKIISRLLSLPEAMPEAVRVPLDANAAARLAHGQAVDASASALPEGALAFLMHESGRALALAARKGNLFAPLRVFSGALAETEMQKDTCNFASLHQNPYAGG